MGISQYPPATTSGGSGGGFNPPKVINNGYSTSGYVPPAVSLSTLNSTTIMQINGVGGASAGVLSIIKSVTGAGIINLLAGFFVANAANTLRFKLTIDGTVVFDSTSASLSNLNRGPIVVGNLITTTALTSQPLKFNSSFVVEMASGAAYAAGDLGILIDYRTE